MGAYCIVRHSPTLRAAIKQKIKMDGVNITHLCKELGIARQNFNGYLNSSDGTRITQLNLMRVCDKLGIKVGLKIEII